MTNKKSTIYDLAALAQVSASTVSAILNGTWRQRRISADTARRVQHLAQAHQFNINRQASGLRKMRSGMIGMIVPLHDNRYFSSMSQTFERMARERQWCPIVASTLRDPALELETVNTLISYRVEYLVVAGATDPDSISRLCSSHGVAHVNVDLPGVLTPSVISDNRWGAERLTDALIARSRPSMDPRRDRIHFLGGLATDHSTRSRIDGFMAAVQAAFGCFDAAQVDACGYEADLAEHALRRLMGRLGGLPRGLLVNSTIAFEGALQVLKTIPLDELQQTVIGCYDWDPFATCLSFPLLMVRQDVEAMIGEAFKIIDSGVFERGKVIEIKPRLMLE
jgi:LacI family fructose operon transcriptional repressor